MVMVLAALLFGNLLFVGAKAGVANAMGVGIATSTTKNGDPACWVAVGNKIYYVVKDETTILKVKASGAL